ncbi:uncharacterized protein LOC110893019 [Helianthus annuus]|uniref:uncharacterized protein LOC110893019 n=1 Tax=Helianthus annuus TaxID=4232 RepID=UPI000B9004F4|nr:uncharacterized protein LOC110893019 [Helianthus annuus]
MGCHGASRPWALLPCSASSSGCWKNIVKVGELKLSNGSVLNSFFSGKLGDGRTLAFWGDAWLSDEPLRLVYPNLFRIEKNKWVKVSERIKMVNNIKTLQWEWNSNPSSEAEVTELFQLLNDIHDIDWKGGSDNWIWRPDGDGVFSMKSAKSLLLSSYDVVQIPKFKWKVWVPIKCRIMVWRAALNRLPTNTELIKRGVNLLHSGCTFCQVGTETACHLFTGCSYSNEVWNRIEVWCRLAPNILFDVSDVLQMPENQSLNKKARGILRGIIYTTLWAIWIERNNRIFLWVCNRSRWKDIEWSSWYLYPLD